MLALLRLSPRATVDGFTTARVRPVDIRSTFDGDETRRRDEHDDDDENENDTDTAIGEVERGPVGLRDGCLKYMVLHFFHYGDGGPTAPYS